MRNQFTDNVLPIVTGIASVLFGFYLIFTTESFLPRLYLTIAHLGGYWRLFGGWVQIFLSDSIAFLVSSSLVAPIAYLFLRPNYQAIVAATSALCVHVLITILHYRLGSIKWQALNFLFFGSLILAEGICVFIFVFAWAKVGSGINSFFKKTKEN